MPAYQHLPAARLPVTERLASTVLGLPMFRGLTRADAEQVGRALERARVRTRGW